MVQLLQQLGADITIKDKVSLYFVFFMYLDIVSYVIEHLISVWEDIHRPSKGNKAFCERVLSFW